MLLPPTRLIIQLIIQNFGEISSRKPSNIVKEAYIKSMLAL